jgi:ribosomal protein L37E
MEQATAKVITALTCWKCGEESLHEAAGAGATRGAHGELLASMELRHSECQKCGSYSVNAAQAQHNKTVGRKARKARIYESNRTSK